MNNNMLMAYDDYDSDHGDHYHHNMGNSLNYNEMKLKLPQKR